MCAVSQQVWVIGTKKVLYLLERTPICLGTIYKCIYLQATSDTLAVMLFDAKQTFYQWIISSCLYSAPITCSRSNSINLHRELCQPSTSLRLDKRHWRTFNKPFRALHNALQGFILPMTHLALIEYKETLQIQCLIPHARYRFKKQALAAAGLSFASSDIYLLSLVCWNDMLALWSFVLFMMW